MIFSVESDLPTFKTVTFHGGLNILLSDKSPKSGNTQTRNSAGKSSLIEIIHFLLGAKAGKDTLFVNSALKEYTFKVTFALGGDVISVARCGAEPSRILISQEVADRFGLKGRADKKSGIYSISNDAWKEFLGHKMFGLPAHLDGSAFDRPNAPTFRSLIPYFARRWVSRGFSRPQQHSEKQQRADWQINISYLLGLDWRIPCELQDLKVRETRLDELRRSIRDGVVNFVIGTVAELRPKMVLAESNAAKLRDDIAKFQVLDSYREYSDRAARAKAEMLSIERRAVSLKEALNQLRDVLTTESAPETDEVSRAYEAIGIELPEMVRRRFDEVSAFHASVVENRRSHLREEIITVESQIAVGDIRVSALATQRSEVMQFLSGHGALEDFLSMQKELAALEAEAAVLRQRFQTAEYLEGEATKLEIERANIKQRLQEDHRVRISKIDRAILIIGAAIAKLYGDRTGEFVVEAADNGPEFGITIRGDRGAGISNMEIFCFDLALFKLISQDRGGPQFLIHDSHLFDGVDERQVAQALRLGAAAAEETSGQYIVMMNSDIYDKLPLGEGRWSDAVLSTRLSDDSENGGLFGFWFD